MRTRWNNIKNIHFARTPLKMRTTQLLVGTVGVSLSSEQKNERENMCMRGRRTKPPAFSAMNEKGAHS
jgi:hypothetical protein